MIITNGKWEKSKVEGETSFIYWGNLFIDNIKMIQSTTHLGIS